MATTQSPLDKPEYRRYLEELFGRSDLSNAEMATAIYDTLGVRTSDTAIRRAKKRWGIVSPKGFEKPSTRLKGDEGWLTGTPAEELATPEELMRERGFDPEEWEIIDATINEWEGAPVKLDQKEGRSANRSYKQLKIRIRKLKKINLLAPAEASDYKRPKVKVNLKRNGGLVVFTGDQQAPFHDVD